MSWTVYCHTHVESGRRYVGLTKYTMMHRWNQHCAQAKRSTNGRSHFPNAIRKYGKDAFSHEVLQVCETLEEANAAEEHWIKKLETGNPEKGFNIMRGGDHIPHPVKNPWDRPEYRMANADIGARRLQTLEARSKNLESLRTEESRKKRSAISKEIQSRPEVKKKLRDANIGKGPNPQAHENSRAASKKPDVLERMASKLRGRKLDEEHRKKTIQIWVGRTHSPEARANMSASLRAGRPGSLSAEDRVAFRRENARLGRLRRKQS